MPPAYQRRRTNEIKVRDNRLKAQATQQAATVDLDVPEKTDLYEVRVPYDDCTKWPRESKFRQEWSKLHERLGFKYSELELYIERNRRPITVARKNTQPAQLTQASMQ